MFFTNLYRIGSGYGKTIHISNTSRHYPWPHATGNKILISITVSDIRGLSKKFVEFVNKNKSTSAVALKFLHVSDPFKPDKI